MVLRDDWLTVHEAFHEAFEDGVDLDDPFFQEVLIDSLHRIARATRALSRHPDDMLGIISQRVQYLSRVLTGGMDGHGLQLAFPDGRQLGPRMIGGPFFPRRPLIGW